MDSDFGYLGLIIEHVDLWEIILLALVVWLWRNPAIFDRVSSFKIGELEVQLRDLEEKIEERRDEIERLERELTMFDAPIAGFDPHAPVRELAEASAAVKARALGMTEFSSVEEALTHRPPEPTALFNASIVLRSRRPTALFADLIELLDHLAQDPNLRGIRLNTVWRLTSGAHLLLISSVRDGVGDRYADATLQRADEVLDRLSNNPRVLADHPTKGVAKPIKDAKRWIRSGLDRQG